MRALGAVLLLAGLMSAQSLPSSWDAPRDAAPIELIDGVECVAGELVIGLRDWGDFPALLASVGGMGDSVLGGIPRLRAARVRIASHAADATVARKAQYLALPFVRYAEPNWIIDLAGEAVERPPNDTYYPLQWNLDNIGQSGGKVGADIDAPKGWLIASGSSDVIAAVIDTGVNLLHPEFEGRLLPGWDFQHEDDDPTGLGHGNRVAGVLGANANNGFEVAGVDRQCKILPLKVGTSDSESFDVAQAIDFGCTHGARVMNMSFMLFNPSDLVHDAIQHAAQSGCIMVAAAGNSVAFGTADNHVPAKFPEVISIGKTDAWDERAIDSATGTTLDFIAPGEDIYTISGPGNGSKKLVSGTSVASPTVAGIVSILLGLNPKLSFDQVYELLRQGAEDQVGDPAEDTPGWDPYYGWGRVNLRRSLEALCGCQGGESLIASPQHVSISASEVVALRIDAGREHAGKTYWVFGSASGAGTWPLGPLTLPITPDDYTRFTFSDANGSVLVNTHGQLDDAGQAMALLMLPQGAGPVSAGILQHVAVVFDGRAAPAHAVLATNVTTTTIEP